MAVLSKSHRVENHIRDKLTRGVWKPGSRLPSEQSLSAELGVSCMTVKTVLSTMARDGLVERKQRLGTYVPAEPQLAHVAILSDSACLTSPTGHFYRQLVEEAKTTVAGAGFHPMLSVGYGADSRDFQNSIHLLEGQVSKQTVGVISTRNLGPLEVRLHKAGIHTVSIVSAAALDECCVVIDYDRMAEIAYETMRSAGYEDYVVFRCNTPEDPLTLPLYRKLGDLSQMLTDGVPDRIYRVPWKRHMAGVYEAFKRFWRQRRPRAVVFLDDSVCDLATRAMLELGIRVPQDLAVLTHWNRGRPMDFPIRLTTIQYDPAEMVAKAWELLSAQIRGARPESPVVWVKPKLIEGQSL